MPETLEQQLRRLYLQQVPNFPPGLDERNIGPFLPPENNIPIQQPIPQLTPSTPQFQGEMIDALRAGQQVNPRGVGDLVPGVARKKYLDMFTPFQNPASMVSPTPLVNELKSFYKSPQMEGARNIIEPEARGFANTMSAIGNVVNPIRQIKHVGDMAREVSKFEKETIDPWLARKYVDPKYKSPGEISGLAESWLPKEKEEEKAQAAVSSATGPLANQMAKEAIEQKYGAAPGTKIPKAVMDEARKEENLTKLLMEANRETTDRKGRLRKLEGLRNIAEGLGNIGFVSAAGLRLGYGPSEQRQPYIAEDIRRDIAKEEDTLGQAEANFLQQATGIPAQTLMGIPASRLQSWLPAQMSLQKSAAAGAKDRERRLQDFAFKFDGMIDNQEKVALGSAKLVMDYLNSNTPFGDKMAIMTIARMAEGTSRLSDEDRKYWKNPFGFTQSIKAQVHRWVTGRLPADQKRQFYQIATDMYNRKLQGVASKARGMSDSLKGEFTPDEILERFLPIVQSYTMEGNQESVTMVLKDGTEVPNINVEMIDQFQKEFPGSEMKL